jgi:hypothetical protein
MQRVIELGRTIRERAGRPLKTPLLGVTVVHTDPEFLADIQGKWKVGCLGGKGDSLVESISGWMCVCYSHMGACWRHPVPVAI